MFGGSIIIHVMNIQGLSRPKKSEEMSDCIRTILDHAVARCNGPMLLHLTAGIQFEKTNQQ